VPFVEITGCDWQGQGFCWSSYSHPPPSRESGWSNNLRPHDHTSSNFRDGSSHVRRQSSNFHDESPNFSDTSPNFCDGSSRVRHQSPDFGDVSPNFREASSNFRDESSHLRRQSPNFRDESPDFRAGGLSRGCSIFGQGRAGRAWPDSAWENILPPATRSWSV
jgi:hypothetical protein